MAKTLLARLLISLLVTWLGLGCNQPEGFKQPEDPLDAGREFIQSILYGDFQKAALHINKDQEDQALFQLYQQYMKKQPQKERLLLKSSSIIIYSSKRVNDTVTLINFANSHSKKPMDLKVIREDNTWKVDFSYTFSETLPKE